MNTAETPPAPARPANPFRNKEPGDDRAPDSVCPVCGGPLHHERCKVICRSTLCGYRIIMTCAEF